MLGRMLTELSIVAEWQATHSKADSPDTRRAWEAWEAFSDGVEAREGVADQRDCFMAGWTLRGMEWGDEPPFAIAKYAIEAIITMLATTRDVSLTGSMLLDETREQVRRMVEAKVRQRREAAPMPTTAARITTAWNNSLGM